MAHNLLSLLLGCCHALLTQYYLDKELEVLVELLREEGRRHEVLPNCVDLRLHFKVLLHDTELVALVKKTQDLAAFEWLLGNVLVNF